jgi:flagellar assembly protein FliH
VSWRPIAAGNQADAVQQNSSVARELADWQNKYSELQLKYQTEVARIQQLSFEEGLRQGRDEAAAAIRDASQKLAATTADLATYKRKVRFDAEREVVRLSMAIARRILNRELTIDPEALEGIVHAALSKLQNREVWHVRVTPGAVDTIKNCIEQAGLTSAVTVSADNTLHTGDLLIDTPSGELDASASTQLQEIERGFAERLGLR